MPKPKTSKKLPICREVQDLQKNSDETIQYTDLLTVKINNSNGRLGRGTSKRVRFQDVKDLTSQWP